MENKTKQKGLDDFFIGEEPLKDSLSPKEAFSSSMTTTTIPKKLCWRPNNYRRKIEVKEKTNSAIKHILSTIPKASYCRHTKLISIKNYKPNITIQYGKNTVTAIYSQNIIGGVKEIFLIGRDTIAEINTEIDKKANNIRKRIDTAIKGFLRQFKLNLGHKKPKWCRYEDFVKGEEFIDKIPREVVIHDTFFKKVYGEGIEFKSTGKGEKPTAHLKNYIKNRAIEDISPLLANEINIFNYTTAQNMAKFSEQIDLHLSVLNKIDKSFNRFNKLLSQKKLKEWF